MQEKTSALWKACLAGALTGLVNGFFGAGGGMLLIPLLTALCKLEAKTAFASSIAIVLPICVASLAVYAVKGSLALTDSLPFLVGGAVGGLAGGLLFRKVSAKVLHLLLGGFILWGGLRLVLS